MFESLDYVYVPAPEIESSLKYHVDILGGKLLWRINAYGVWVACISLLRDEKPYILLADHISKNDVMLIYRVASLSRAVSELRSK